ncbi:MAG: sigma 54-interacting transcriptional regulator [Desulfobacteraceae bacterium]
MMILDGIDKKAAEQIKRLKDQLNQKTFKLEERKKELNCLYSLSKIAEKGNLDIDLLMQRVVEILPSSLQHPEVTAATARVFHEQYQSRPHTPTKSHISAPIKLSGNTIGTLTAYLIGRPDNNTSKQFLPEEQDLINGICERVGKIIERIRANEQLKELEARYQRLVCTLRDVTEKKAEEHRIHQEKTLLERENIRLRSTMNDRYRFQNIIGISPAMQKVYDQILTAARSDANVAVYGESGTGKELVAKAIHDLSSRDADTFVTINCGAIPEPLLESEFFGYKKGAFTGATIDKHGYLDLADTGTLFLDEIGDLPLTMQVKLLRAIDGGGYFPIGSHAKHTADFRIIAATNKNLKQLMVDGLMREDFYYRIQVIPISLPPLKDRKEDIPLLVEHFTGLYAENSPFTHIPNDIIAQIFNHDWPGNIRELQNALLRFFSTGEFEILQAQPQTPRHGDNNGPVSGDKGSYRHLSHTIEKTEKEQIVTALQSTHWHRNHAAGQLGISRSTLYRRMKKYGLDLKQNVRS